MKLLTRIKENIALSVTGLIVVGAITFFGVSAQSKMLLAEENEKSIIIIQERDKNQNLHIKKTEEVLGKMSESVIEMKDSLTSLKADTKWIKEILRKMEEKIK